MHLIKLFNKWRNERFEEHVSKMKVENKCPDCYGRGFIVYPANVYSFHSDHFRCPGCEGSGLYEDWKPH
ncbi:methionine aminopeptidase [Cytobacillus horneckiae]|uniref:Methionine aminopeptidase n=2 Tax=Cytobacillus horneckiae TaxID=549687 RepID=A0A2N0ZC18_9BACI|nr:methionine aminopeptidase [Cytobacillus horneckiae]NRG45729.1 methionine aminopeptidase [Bacillus sp. CRN 9]MBN6885915.1 methionine aminopeptidase [Cytobacillus horneckiae]MCM3177457.1 methionine aminopeptidase [Cytobacillus horneckiae]MEC1155980.1 methionine aminopeptidase [Cytobacillus horneckiae]MED2939744.1 methionine aminopeptidase [Cytobacillus horneckiae]